MYPERQPESDAWVDGLTIGQVLETSARKVPSQDALVFPRLKRRLSYRDFLVAVDIAARGLLSLGINKGEHVAIWATNVPEWVILQMATARIGVVLVTINPAYRTFELEYTLRQCDAKALFFVDRFKTSDYIQMLGQVCPELATSTPGELQSTSFPELRWMVSLRGQVPPGSLGWDQLLARGTRNSERAFQDAKNLPVATDPINIQYTSGTTGFPKAATLTHRNLLMNAFYIGACQDFSDQDRVCVPVPFYHCFGCVLGTLCAIVHGATIVIPNQYFEARSTLEAIDETRATAIYGVPTMFIAMLEDPDFLEFELSSLRTGIMAGSPCPIEIMKKVVDVMGARELTIAYGLTEASPVITQTRTDDPIELRVKTVGRPIPGLEVQVIDPESGEPLPDGQTGELCTRGHGVMLGYYKNPEATREVLEPNGWLHTGDLAIRRPDGYFQITGRIKDMIIRGGENVYPREIEECLFGHPSIEQATVVGIPDRKFGETVCAWIQVREKHSLTVEAVQDYCRSQLAHFKVPQHVRFVQAFPQTVTGKIQKFKIREKMIKDLDLEETETA